MRTSVEADIFPVGPTLGAIHQSESMTTTARCFSPHRSRSNSNSSEPASVLSDYLFIPSSPSSISLLNPSNTSLGEVVESHIVDEEIDLDLTSKFVCPTDSEDEESYDYDSHNNDELFLQTHVTKQQLDFINTLRDKPYKRSKRTNKKVNAQRQIKTKHAKSIRTNSHNKNLYMHHRLAKKVTLDGPSLHCIPSSEPVPLYSLETLHSIAQAYRHAYSPSFRFYATSPHRYRHSESHHTYIEESQTSINAYQYLEYTLNGNNIPDESSFDDDMIHVLLDMQNRDLSPEDYEMLLRLDERVQPKTVNTNVLDTLTTVAANEIHLDEQCAICMEQYQHGQQIKLLPCKHMFHLNCIDKYLKEFSIQCPLDNLPLV